MRADWPLVSRAKPVLACLLLTACASRVTPPASDMPPPLLLTEDNFYSQIAAEPVHPNEAAARVAMAECAAMGTLSAAGQGRRADAVLAQVVDQLQLALQRSGANAYALQTQHWERTQGEWRLEIMLQGLICSA